MYKIWLIFSFSICFCFICSCKTISSRTQDILKEDNGRYYYAWTSSHSDPLINGTLGILCIGICTQKPLSIKDALTSVCNNEVKYFKIPYKSHHESFYKEYVSEEDIDIGFLYKIAEESSDATEVCLSDDVIQGKTTRIYSFIEWDDGDYIHVFSKPTPSNLHMLFEEYDKYMKNYHISTMTVVNVLKGSNKQKKSDKSLDDNSKYVVIVKPVVRGQSYSQAKEYCKIPNEENKKYVKDWNKVELGGDKFSNDWFSKHWVWLAIWAEDSKKNPKLSDEDTLTVCVTNADNLQDAYVSRISIDD